MLAAFGLALVAGATAYFFLWNRGHSLKHVAAAVAGLVVCRMLMQRTLEAPDRTA